MRSANWSSFAARSREVAEKFQSDLRLSVARPKLATRRRCWVTVGEWAFLFRNLGRSAGGEARTLLPLT